MHPAETLRFKHLGPNSLHGFLLCVMMLKKEKTCLINKKGFLGLGTVGGFWLVVCCCWHPVSAPRPAPAMPRDRVLLTTGRVTEQTKKFRGDLLDRLVQYLEEHLPGHCLDDLARNHLPTFSEWLEEYMIHLYVNQQTRQSAAETLNALTQKYGFLRHSLGGPWDILRTWDTLEPGQHHLPMPVSVVRALITTALCWNWSKFAVTLALGFYGLLRPSESINMRRQDVSLPHEHLQGDVIYLRVGQPKTRNKAAKQQHVRVDEPGEAGNNSKSRSSEEHDGDGSLEAEEIQRALTLLGIDRDLERLIEELDSTQDGQVSFEEFLAWWRKNIMEARCVVTTSAKAWQSIVTNVNPPLNLGPLVLLKVTFTFCRSCRAFEPKWRKYSDQYKNIRFVELVGNGTVGAMEFCTKDLGVKASPAFFMFRRGTDGGQLLMSWTGASVEKFETNVNTCIEQEAERQACDA
eukprot:symbB.v1.2.035333.t1/scaffold4731.1/size35673/2